MSGTGAGSFLDSMERWVALDDSPDTESLCGALFAWLRSAQKAQPHRALVHQLAARALSIAESARLRGDDARDTRSELNASIAREREDLGAQHAAVVAVAAQLVPERDAFVATLAHSGLVERTMLALHAAGRTPRAIIGEGRPGLEGRVLARVLASAGIPAWIVTDAALPMLVGPCAAVLLGADAVTDRGVVVRAGSLAVALAARESSVPVYALAPRRRFLPAETRALAIVEHDPAELWADPPAGVHPRSLREEMVPLTLLRGVVVEDGVMGASEVAVAAQDRALPESLAAPLPR